MSWKYFHGHTSERSEQRTTLPSPPPWREFFPRNQVNSEKDARYWTELDQLAEANIRSSRRGESFRLPENEEGIKIVDAVNAAIHLRRPILVTGAPGSGKTSLAYAIAYELKLGSVLTWPITARSNLIDALYRYDAIARLQDAQLDYTRNKPQAGEPPLAGEPEEVNPAKEEGDLGDYIQLGPVGTAFVPSQYPRVLLIDEIDKSDLNLPNDLLNLFEEGEFEIPELVRRKRLRGKSSEQNKKVMVRTADKDMEVPIANGRIQCCEFPIVIMTSNGERDFPPAFNRRCLRVTMPNPTEQSLLPIVQSHFSSVSQDDEEVQNQWIAQEDNLKNLIKKFLDRGSKADRSTDQLLNAIYIKTRSESPDDQEFERLVTLLFKRLSEVD